MTTVRASLSCLFALSLISVTASAAEGVDVSTRLGGHGLGLELSKSVTPNLRARVGLNTHEQDWSSALDEAHSLNQVFRSVSAVLDWHPWGDQFRLSGGLMLGGDRGDGSIGAARLGYEGERTADENARLSNSYLGVGWASNVGDDGRFGFAMDFGLVFSSIADGGSDPASGGQRSLIPVDALQDGDLARIWGGLQNQAVFSLGMKYRF